MFNLQSVTIEIQGKTYAVPEPTKRVARRLRAGIVRLFPKLIALRMALVDAGITNDKPTEQELAEMPPDALASMLEIFDPLCDFLKDSIPGISQDAVDNADEAELVKAFWAIRDLVNGPLSKSGSAQTESAPKQSDVTPPSSTSAEQPTQTTNGSPGSTS